MGKRVLHIAKALGRRQEQRWARRRARHPKASGYPIDKERQHLRRRNHHAHTRVAAQIRQAMCHPGY